ncbi:MAG: imidazolonepropionase [Pseudomonadota bacterium]
MQLHNLTALTMAGSAPYGLVEEAAIVMEDGRITWVGAASDAPHHEGPVHDLGGRLVTPGLIDCHTHLVHGGDRAAEFEMRLQGASYEEIARAGGGIISTVKATRAASEDDLVSAALPRLDALIAEGVTTVEIKSGYGLTVEDELRQLRAARRLPGLRPIRIKTTYLAAHAIPTNYADQPQAYIDEVAIPGLYRAHEEGLVDAVDGFCEGIAFTPEQLVPLFDVAVSLGLPVKLHAEQLSHSGGTALAAQYGALSADHVEYATDRDAEAMAAAGTVATILPGAFYTLREIQAPPIDAFRQHHVPMALATDANPGSSPLTSLLLTLNLACTLFRLAPEEALRGVTQHGATALGLGDSGIIAKGCRADLAVWNITHPAELAYRMGFNPLHARIFNGEFDP